MICEFFTRGPPPRHWIVAFQTNTARCSGVQAKTKRARCIVERKPSKQYCCKPTKKLLYHIHCSSNSKWLWSITLTSTVERIDLGKPQAVRRSFLLLINVLPVEFLKKHHTYIASAYISRNSTAELHFTSLLSLFSIWGALWRAHFHQATTKVFALSILSKQNETESTPKGASTCCVTSLKSQSKPSAQLLAGGSSRLHDSEQAVSEVPRFFWVSSLQSETYWTYHLDLRQNRKLESTESSSQALKCAQFNLPSLPASKLITATVPEW